MLGNEGAGVIEDAGDSGLAVGSVMYTGPYGVGENGAWQEWLLVRPEHLALVPDAVAYLAARVTLMLAGFKPGMAVPAPWIGGSRGHLWLEVRSVLARIACPTLLVSGSESFLPDPAAAGVMKDFENAELARIEGLLASTRQASFAIAKPTLRAGRPR